MGIATQEQLINTFTLITQPTEYFPAPGTVILVCVEFTSVFYFLGVFFDFMLFSFLTNTLIYLKMQCFKYIYPLTFEKMSQVLWNFHEFLYIYVYVANSKIPKSVKKNVTSGKMSQSTNPCVQSCFMI